MSSESSTERSVNLLSAVGPTAPSDLLVIGRLLEIAGRLNLQYPIEQTEQLGQFLQTVVAEGIYAGANVGWFDKYLKHLLPIKDVNDFTVKAKLAVDQTHVLDPASNNPDKVRLLGG